MTPAQRPRLPALLLPALLLIVALGASACGSPAPVPTRAPAPASAAPAPGHGGHGGAVNDPSSPVGLWAVQTGGLGVIATDGGGRVLYRSDADSATPPTSACTGDCTTTWTPLLVADGQQLDLEGVRGEVVGRMQRPDGTTQLTLAGWPVYVHADDDGQLVGTGAHGAGGRWWAMTPTGEKAHPA